jgi:hypothetical protein
MSSTEAPGNGRFSLTRSFRGWHRISLEGPSEATNTMEGLLKTPLGALGLPYNLPVTGQTG